MNIKNKIMFISLIVLVLLSITCVSATQEIGADNTLTASDISTNDVTSYGTAIQSNESDDDSQMNVLSYVSDITSSDSNENNNDLSENNVDAASDVGEAVKDYALGAGNDKRDVYFVAPNRTLMIDEISGGYIYPIILKDENGGIANAKVTLIFNGEKYVETTNDNGWAYYDISVDKTGSYKITLKFAGDADHNSLSKYGFTTVKVLGHNVTFVAPNRTLMIDEISEGYRYPIILKDENGVGIANKNVTLIINGQKYVETTNNRGWAYFNISVSKIGNYKITLKFTSDGYYNSLSKWGFTEVKVLGHDVTIVVKNKTFWVDDISEGYRYAVTLMDDDGNPIGNRNVTLIFNGQKYVEKTNNKGHAYFNISVDKAGTYKITVKFASDGYYYSLSKYNIANIIVKGHDVTFVAPNRTLLIDEISGGYTYPVILRDDNGNGIANRDVTLIFNGQKYVETTNSKGWAYFNISVDKVGKYKITLKFATDGYYNSLSSYSITTVEVLVRKNVNFVASGKTLLVDEISGGYSYPVTLKDENGKVLANKKITLTFNGKNYVQTTDANGQAYFVISVNKVGSYGISLNFAGDKFYYENTAQNYRTIKVVNPTVVIVAGDASVPLDKIYFGYNYPVLLKDDKGNVLANKQITVNFNGERQVRTTDNNGYCYFNLTAHNRGSFGITITFAGDGYYRSASCSKTIHVTESTNPYGNKAKKVWINADGGSGPMKEAIANLLRALGWEVYVSGTGPGYHYDDYFRVTSDYQAYITLYNGFCAGTVREAYSSSIQNTLNRKGVQLVIMWDTSDWTNPQGMAPYRYGDFTGYTAHRAWDDNFSSSDPTITNVGAWLKSQNAVYCANPTAEGLVAQFVAGGYFAYSGK